MNDKTHTPGPWQRIGWTPCGVYGPGGLSDAERIATIDARQEHEANARLIASAPDMLEALYECAEYLDNFADAEFTQDGPNPNEAMVLLMIVRRAIDKAEAA